MVYIATDGGGQTGVASNDFSTIDIAVFVDGVVTVNGLFRRVICANTAGIIAVVCNWSMSGVIPLAAGPHTITVQARLIQANAIAVVSGNNGSVLQGALTVMVLKQ